MVLIADTGDGGRSRACTATAVQALRQPEEMTVSGLAPIVTDINGRQLSFETLSRRARLELPQ